MSASPTEPPTTGPVIIGYDADGSGADALTLGVGLGAALGLPVIVAKVHASPAPIGAGRVDAEWVADRRAASASILATAERQVDELQLSEGQRATAIEYRLVPSSSAAHGLHDLAVSTSAALIVVGSAATEGYDRRVFAGSTASRLLSGAECPVAVAPKGFAGAGWKGPERIGVAYLATGEGMLALRTAADVARLAGASLHLYTAVAEEASVVPWLIGEDSEKAFTATARESAQHSLDAGLASVTEGVEVTASLLVGDVVGSLAELRVDLLFCGSRAYGPVRRVLLGGVSSRLVRRAVSPVVIVPRAD